MKVSPAERLKRRARPPRDVDDAAWRADLARERAWREALYLGLETPLSPEALDDFQGLRWFAPDPSLRLQGVRLERHPSPRPGGLPATGEDAVALLEVGRLRFALEGHEHVLLAYEPAPGEADEPYILVPFRDATSGKETYGGGRYVDLEPRADDVYELDLNRAYHPYCAHDDAWACVLPPPQNRLAVPVRAGERL